MTMRAEAEQADPGYRLLPVERVASDGTTSPIERAIATERPIAMEYNGFGYAVMMATPADLNDFGTGFALSERLVDHADEVVDMFIHETPDGILLRATLAPHRVDRVVERVRHRVSESSCGLCGIENLEAAIRPLPRVAATSHATEAAIFRALGALRDHQPLNRATGAVHGAALCSADGDIVMVREDVGRHNAFDKLIGAMARAGRTWDGGFALLTSRCSFELVEKAALADCPLLVTVSAPTGLAIERARAANVRLFVLARPDALLIA